jgi:hypothetical protein
MKRIRRPKGELVNAQLLTFAGNWGDGTIIIGSQRFKAGGRAEGHWSTSSHAAAIRNLLTTHISGGTPPFSAKVINVGVRLPILLDMLYHESDLAVEALPTRRALPIVFGLMHCWAFRASRRWHPGSG